MKRLACLGVMVLLPVSVLVPAAVSQVPETAPAQNQTGASHDEPASPQTEAERFIRATAERRRERHRQMQQRAEERSRKTAPMRLHHEKESEKR